MKQRRTVIATICKFIQIAGCLTLLALSVSCASTRLPRQARYLHPKHEFRGAWIQTIYQDDYRNLTSEAFRNVMTERLDRLKAYGINAIIFQVRPEADAFYASPYEPWSRFLTGEQGRPPDEPDFDPMAFLIDACRQRNMEFHAWLNPYRAKANKNSPFADTHIYHAYPEWFVEYNNQILFDPGIPDCRRFICQIVRDIVSRYDVDAIHMDDYFYPYPVAGMEFPDSESFECYGRRNGFTSDRRNDWRRDNVNRLIKEIKQTIQSVKPWVRFGISPFGIYRNQRTDPSGSRTNGLQNYDDLYADILLWMKEGWIDYCAPQLYWEIGHQAADYHTLLVWWTAQKSKIPLYIGQDVARTMNAKQLSAKLLEARKMNDVQGQIYWPANELLWNNGNIIDSLQGIYHRYPTLIPAYTHLSKKTPAKAVNLQTQITDQGIRLEWQASQNRENPESTSYFVVYRFRQRERVRTARPESIYALTSQPFCLIPFADDRTAYVYTVTAVNRFHNESKRSKKIRIGFR
jgi:uncharacterized lipoprotein YddW (UPF0748 family)